MAPRFLQIHTLVSYPATLLNRDDAGFAKRIPFGGSERTRISSQCLKRHWRTTDDDQALDRIREGDLGLSMSIRSRRTFDEYLRKPLVDGGMAADIASALTQKIMESLLPEGKKKQAAARDEEPSDASEKGDRFYTDQVTVLGRPEMDYLSTLARRAAEEAADAKAAVKAFDEINKRDLKKNLATLERGAGLDAALFGRMTTGDVLARCDAAIHVAHSFTVHNAQAETDYFSALDDLLPRDETGSGHINTAELTTGLYYGYVVVDLPLLVSNLEACDRRQWLAADRSLAAEVVRRLVHLIATVSPGAKLGATAPYSHASLVLLEAGRRQPRTLANAFSAAVPARGDMLQAAYEHIARHLEEHDRMYGREAGRRLAAMNPSNELLAQVDGRLDLQAAAEWAADVIRQAA